MKRKPPTGPKPGDGAARPAGKVRCEKCGPFVNELRPIRVRCPGKAAVYLPGVRHWCGGCRVVNRGKWMRAD